MTSETIWNLNGVLQKLIPHRVNLYLVWKGVLRKRCSHPMNQKRWNGVLQKSLSRTRRMQSKIVNPIPNRQPKVQNRIFLLEKSAPWNAQSHRQSTESKRTTALLQKYRAEGSLHLVLNLLRLHHDHIEVHQGMRRSDRQESHHRKSEMIRSQMRTGRSATVNKSAIYGQCFANSETNRKGVHQSER